MNNFPSECFLIIKISTPRIVECRNGEVGCVLTCFTDNGGVIEFWGVPDADGFHDKMGNINEILEYKDMLPILVECEHCSFTYENKPKKFNWDDEIDIIDFNVSI